jgi:hypothetical protein
MTSEHRRDLLVAAGLAACAGVVAGGLCLTLDARFFDPRVGNDVWFEGDLARIADEMTHRFAAHSRATVHPLFSLASVAVAYPLRAAGLSVHAAVSVIVGLAAAAWVVACYALLRQLVTSRADACLFTALSLSSAAVLFWATVPETAAAGSATMLVALALAARASRGDVGDRALTIASAASLAVTVTNWMAGLAAAAMLRPRRRGLQATANALAIVVVLWCAQRVIVPRADFFFGYSNEERYLLRPEAGGPLAALAVTVGSSMVLPQPGVYDKPGRGPILTVQHSGWRAQTVAGRVALVLWLTLLACGGWELARRRELRTAYVPLLLVLGGQLGLCALYGTESFLYALNVLPLLAGVAAAGTEGTLRRSVRAVVVALLILSGINNATRLAAARRYFTATPAVAASTASMLAPTSVPSSAELR